MSARLLRVSCLRASHVSADTIDLLLPDEKTPTQDQLIKAEPGTLIWRAQLPDRTHAVLKMYRHRSPLQASRTRLRSLRARREYDALTRLRQSRVPCSEPLFWAHGEDADHARFELLATRAIARAVPLGEWLPGASAEARLAALCRVYGWVRAMHADGVRHGGLSFKNVLVAPASTDPELFLIDFSRSVLFPFDLAGTRMAWFDLADLTTKVIRRLGLPACATVLAAYGLSPEEAERVTDFAARHKSTRSLRRRLRLEFRVRARLGAVLGNPRVHAPVALGMLLQDVLGAAAC